MKKPIRLQLSRRAGFRLQATSLSTNGLEAVNCARPSEWGNPCRVVGAITPALACVEFDDYARSMLKCDPHWLDPLRGKNLGCWCKIGQPCHADILLVLANPSKSRCKTGAK